MSNPLRLREMQERNGIKPKKDKKKKEKEKEKKLKKDKYRDRPMSPRDERGRSRSPERYSRSPSPASHYRSTRSQSDEYDRHDRYDRYDRYRDDRKRGYSRSRSPEPRRRGRRTPSRSPIRPAKRMRDASPPRRPYNNGGSSSSNKPLTGSATDRAAKLAAMTANASTMSVDRRERLTQLLEKEKAELEAEERARSKSKGMGSFLSHESKKVFSGEGGLEERIRRGRGQLYVGAD